MKLSSQIAITVILAVLLAVGWIWLAGDEDTAQSSETPRKGSAATLVLTEAIELAEDRVVVRTIGTGEALKSVSIHPSVAGEVIEVAFKAGQRVKKNAVLLRLDDMHQRLAVRLAEVAVKEARRQFKRLEQLAPSGAVSQARLETKQAELERLRQALLDCIARCNRPAM